MCMHTIRTYYFLNFDPLIHISITMEIKHMSFSELTRAWTALMLLFLWILAFYIDDSNITEAVHFSVIVIKYLGTFFVGYISDHFIQLNNNISFG